MPAEQDVEVGPDDLVEQRVSLPPISLPSLARQLDEARAAPAAP